MKKIRSRKRRSDTKIMTKEARVLKFLRESRGLSIRRVASVIGVSEAIVNHAENGRLDLGTERIVQFVMEFVVRKSPITVAETSSTCKNMFHQ